MKNFLTDPDSIWLHLVEIIRIILNRFLPAHKRKLTFIKQLAIETGSDVDGDIIQLYINAKENVVKVVGRFPKA